MGLHTEAEMIEVSKSSVIKHVGKSIGVVALAIASAFFAAYCRKAFGGVIFALSFVLVVAASIPMVMFFNFFQILIQNVAPRLTSWMSLRFTIFSTIVSICFIGIKMIRVELG